MAEEQEPTIQDEIPPEGEPKADPLKEITETVKGWQNKYEESLEMIKQANQQNAVLLEQMQQQRQPAPLTEEDPEDWYGTTPAEYKARIKQELLAEVSETVNQTQNQKAQLNVIANDLFGKYPDLNKKDTPLRKEADNYYDALPQHLKGTPEGYELAISRAVSKTGAKAAVKRINTDEDDDFSFGGGNSSSGGGGKKMTQLGDADYDFARRSGSSGLNLNDPKVLARVEKRKKELLKMRGGR